MQLKLSLLGHAYNDSYHFIIPLLLPFFRQEFSFTYLQSGLILTIHVALRSIFSLVFGSLGDHFNHKHLFIAFGFILSSILLGSVIWVSSLPLVVTALLLMAIGVSTFHPLATAMVGEKAKPGKQGHDLSFFNAGGTIGLSIMSLLFGWLVQLWGWRMACLIISLPGFLLGWGYIQLKNEVPVHDSTETKLTYKSLYIILFTAHGLRNLGTWAILSFLPTYATDYIGLRPALSAWVISIFFVGVLSGNLSISNIIDQKSPLKFVNFATISAALLIFTLTYSTIPIVTGLLVFSIGLSQGFYFPAQNTWLTRVSTNKTRGKLFGFTIFVEGISATIAPSLYGWLADNFGLVFAYRLASIPILIGFFFYIILYYMVKTSKNTRLRNTIALS